MANVTEESCEFWCVWTKTGRIPRFAHDTEALAKAEAERLAHVKPGKKFIVMRAYHKVHVAVPVAADSIAEPVAVAV